MTTVSPLRGFKDMPYGHTACRVTLLNLSRQKERNIPQGKGTTNKTFYSVTLLWTNYTNDLNNSEDKWKSIIQEIYWRLDASALGHARCKWPSCPQFQHLRDPRPLRYPYAGPLVLPARTGGEKLFTAWLDFLAFSIAFAISASSLEATNLVKILIVWE